MNGLRLFFSYCHKDGKYIEELEKWLSPFREQGLVEEWYDRKLIGGENLENIKSNMEEADIILLLFSQDYIASTACREEMSFALSNVDKKRIIPIILKSCTWKETGCKNLLALPTDAKPIDTWKSTEAAWLDIYNGIKKVIENLQMGFDIKNEFREEIEQVEFVKQGKAKIRLNDIFIFPFLTQNRDAVSEEVKSEDYFIQGKDKSIIIKGSELSGKTSLLRWLFLKLRDGFSTILINGDEIFKTLNFEDHVKRVFQKEFTGSFDTWKMKDNKVAIIDNFHHKISSNIMKYLSDNFAMIIIGMDDEEYMVYFKDDPVYAECSIVSLRQLSLSKQEELIRKWMQLNADGEAVSEINDLSIDKLEDQINNIITTNRIVPRFPFYILSILQSLEAFMPRDYSITAYGHCYHALITAQLLKKNVKHEEIDSCFNYLTELSFDIYQNTRNGKTFTKLDYLDFKSTYKSKFFILDSVINKIESDDYPIISIYDEHAFFEFAYIYFLFLGKYFAEKKDQSLINEICENIHLKQNAFIIIFTIHHAQNKELLETVLAHCVCSFDKIAPAELNTTETQFMNTLISELPKSIISNKPVSEIRRDQRDDKEVQNEKAMSESEGSEEDVSLTEIYKGMKIIDVLGQILKNRAGSFEKGDVIEIIEHTTDLGLRILNFFLDECRRPEFRMWLAKMLEEAEKDFASNQNRRFDDDKRIKFVEKTIQVFGYMITIGMLIKISHSIGTEKLITAVSQLSERKGTPAYKMIDFLVELSQNGINVDSLRDLNTNFEKSKNYWAQKTLSFYVQNYLNTHRIEFRKRQRLFGLLGIPYLPNK